VCGFFWSANAQNPDDLAKCEAAIPMQATIKIDTPRKLLVFTLCKGFVHSSIPLGVKALEMMGSRTGAYTITQSDDPAVFQPERLAQFDAVCMLSTTGELFEDETLKQSLLNFVKSGKGLVGIHAATDCFYNWPAYGEMMGGYFDGHPWGSGDTVICKVDDPAHPIAAAFKARSFTIQDEIYQFQAKPYSREQLRVLLSLDTNLTDMSKGGIKRTDNDFAVSWVQTYGEGRVFYCSLGHNESVFWNPTVLRHYLDGIQFALGDLAVDTTPSAKLTPEQVEASLLAGNTIRVEEAFKDLPAFRLGDDAELPRMIEQWVVDGNYVSSDRSALELRLATALRSNPTEDARRIIVQHLARIGTNASLEALTELLVVPASADDARVALERLATPEARAVLRHVASNATGNMRIGCINSLGNLRDVESIPIIAPMARAEDADMATAAQTALGKIGGAEAEKALLSALAVTPPESAGSLLSACASAALAREARGETALAAAFYTRMIELSPTPRCRIVALQGMARTDPDHALVAIIEALQTADTALHAGAATAARALPSTVKTESLSAALSKLPSNAQVHLLYALADRGDAAALPAVTGAVQSADTAVSLAAVAALGKLGDASSVVLLAGLAAKASENLQVTARASLAALRGSDTNNAIIAAIEPADGLVRAELVRALGARNARESIPALLTFATDPDETVRQQIYETLATLAGTDNLRAVVGLLASEQSDLARAGAEKAVVAVLARGGNPAEQAQVVLSVLPEVKQGIAGYCSMLRVLGKIDDPLTLEALVAATTFRNTEVRTTAARALAEWPTVAPMQILYDMAAAAEEAPLRDILLRGYVRMIENAANTGDRKEQYGKAFIVARTADERKVVLASIGKQTDPRLVDVVAPYANDADTSQEVALVMEKLRKLTFSLKASHGAESLALALDGDIATRWTTNAPQVAGQWLEIDLGYVGEFSKVVLDSTPSPGDYPRAYSVFIATDTSNWGEPVVSGIGTAPITEITIEPRPGRYMRIEQTGKDDGLWWSIHELRLEAK